MQTPSKDKAILKKTELNQFVDFIKQENTISNNIKDKIISIITNGYKDKTEYDYISSIMSRIEYTIQNSYKLDKNNQIELLKSCSKISLALTLLDNNNQNSKKEILKDRLLKGAMIKDHDKIELAIKKLYPKGGMHKAKLIGKILNLMAIFRSNDIIGILKHKLKVVSYHKKKYNEEAEISILDGTHLKNYFVFRNKTQYSNFFIAGEDSLRSLYNIFDISISQNMLKKIKTIHPKTQLIDTLKGQEARINNIENKIEKTLKDNEQLQKIKEKLKLLKRTEKDTNEMYQENTLDTLANFQQSQDNSKLIKDLLPTRGFINRFKEQEKLPNYIYKLFTNLKNPQKDLNNEDLIILYLYFAQHHHIASSSIESVVDNLNTIGIDIRLVKDKLEKQYISILDIIEIIDTAPNYFKQVEQKNGETIDRLIQKYKANLKESINILLPIFLTSKNIYMEDQEEIYALYNGILSPSEQKEIKEVFKKRSFDINNYNSIKNTEKTIDNMKNIEKISTLAKTLEQLILFTRKLKYHNEYNNNNTITKYLQNLYDNNLKFKELLPKEKKKLRNNIKNKTRKNIKGPYLLIEIANNNYGIQKKLNDFTEKSKRSLITKEHKTLRNFLYNTKGTNYNKAIIDIIKDEYNAGIISEYHIEKIDTMTKRLDKYTNNLGFNMDKFKERIALPHILAFNNIDKTLIQDNRYFHPTQIKNIKKAKDVLDQFSKKLEIYNTSEIQFMEQLMCIHENTNKILLTPDVNLNPTIETLNPERFKTTIQNTLETFEPAKIIRAYDNILHYKNAEEQSELIQLFQNNAETINKLTETYNINEQIIQNINKIISLLNKNTNNLASPVVFNYMQNLVYLATKQHDKITDTDKKYFAALKRQKVFTNLENSKKSLEKITNKIVEDILDHSKKSTVMSSLVKGTTRKDSNKRRIKNYDPTLSIDNRNIKSFLGTKNIREFLLGINETYTIPQYIKQNLNSDFGTIIKSEQYTNYLKKIKEIENYINDNYIRL